MSSILLLEYPRVPVSFTPLPFKVFHTHFIEDRFRMPFILCTNPHIFVSRPLPVARRARPLASDLGSSPNSLRNACSSPGSSHDPTEANNRRVGPPVRSVGGRVEASASM